MRLPVPTRVRRCRGGLARRLLSFPQSTTVTEGGTIMIRNLIAVAPLLFVLGCSSSNDSGAEGAGAGGHAGGGAGGTTSAGGSGGESGEGGTAGEGGGAAGTAGDGGGGAAGIAGAGGAAGAGGMGGSAGAGGSGGLAKKWFPGHYLAIRHYNGPIQQKSRDLVKTNPYFKGYKIHVVWNELEPQKDAYDFSVIANALQIAGDDQKKLMVHLQDRKFNSETNPYLPDYLLTAEYEGGWFYDGDKSLPRAWLPAYRDRWTKLLVALGEELDDHPDFAGFMLSESSGLFATKNMPASWTSDGIMAFARETFSTLAQSLPTTPFFQYVNWGLTKATRDELMRELVEINGHGFGGPDICDGGDKLTLDMQFGEYYDTYRGVAPICVENQPSGYLTRSAKEIFDYAVDQIGVHFLPWSPSYDRAWTIEDAIAVVNKEKGRVNPTVPLNIKTSP